MALRTGMVLTATAATTVLATGVSGAAVGWQDASPAPPSPGSLAAVDATATGAWAVGTETTGGAKAVVFRRQGQSWTKQTLPVQFTPTDVAAADASNVWVGGLRLVTGVTLHWNGSAWSMVYGPQRTGNTTVSDIDRVPGGSAVLSAGNTWAQVNGQNNQYPIIEQSG